MSFLRLLILPLLVGLPFSADSVVAKPIILKYPDTGAETLTCKICNFKGCTQG